MTERMSRRTILGQRASGRRLAVAARRLAALLATLFVPCLAAAGGFDEFQVYDGRITEPGSFDIDQYLTFGRRGRSGEGAPRNGVLATTQIGYATAAWHEVSLYLPVAKEFSGDLYGGGLKLLNTFVVPGAADRPFAFGFDVELRHQSGRFSSADWAMTLRPIIDLRTGPWQLILNPAVEFPLGREGPVFAPATRGVRRVAESVWLGVEHYADFGRVDRWETARRQAHQLFATTDVKLGERFAVHAGVGHGLTRNSDRWLGKVILSFGF